MSPQSTYIILDILILVKRNETGSKSFPISLIKMWCAPRLHVLPDSLSHQQSHVLIK